MKIETYRGAPFVDREEEIEFFVDWFSEVPQRILWVYGPKSSGKTTVIEYVVEKELLAEKEWWVKGKYWVKYINLRRKLISNYKTFLHSFIIPDDVYREAVESDKKFSLKVFSIERKKIKEIEKREQDLFEILIKEIEKERKNRIPILIIDEIQKLEDVYINGGRELLKEFLNFCVSLTKEMHLAHVVILTSNTLFIERIYNDAKMKETSKFKKIGHLNKEKVFEWLQIENFMKDEIDLVWEYYGGNISRILEAVNIKKKGRDLEEFLKREAWFTYTEIVDFIARGGFGEGEIEMYKDICREILENGYFEFNENRREYLPVIESWTKKEILFYDPLELRVTGNSRIYEKGMEILLDRL